jgi:hypothetical protein
MTNNKQQTAVEWFIEQLNSKYGGNDFLITHINEIGKAKEMDKELTIRFALFYAYGQDNVSEQLRTKIEKWYDKIFEGGEQ